MLNKIVKFVLEYFYRVGVLCHFGLALLFLGGMSVAVLIFQRHDLPANVFFHRAATTLQAHQSPLVNKMAMPALYLANVLESSEPSVGFTFALDNGMLGAQSSQSTSGPERTFSAPIYVKSSDEFITALKAAKAGDDIVVMPGDYKISTGRIYLLAEGTFDKPIRIRALQYGTVNINLDSFEGFVIKGDHWHVENLKINGICATHQACEHAIHITGASGVIIRNNFLSNFNSILKANGDGDSLNRRYPDNVIIENNTFINQHARITNSAVTHIDVVAGNNWQIRKNILLNNSKQGGDYTSYAAFLKGDAYSGVFEQNIVDCEYSLLNDESTRIGLSFGGGGTGQNYCREGICEQEHSNGTMRNNLILNCSQDVGIYINRGLNSKIYNNTVLNTLGIDVRYAQSTAHVIHNQLDGEIRSRDAAQVIKSNNWYSSDLESIQRHLSQVDVDLCGFKRNKFSPVGALTEKCLELVKLKKENVN